MGSRQPIPRSYSYSRRYQPVLCLIMTFPFAQGQLVDVFSRSAAMMHSLSRVRQGLADKIERGAYEGREELLKDDVERLDMYVPFIHPSEPSQ